MKLIVILFITLMSAINVNAQRTCGTVEYNSKNPLAAPTHFSGQTSRDPLSNEVINIPVVIHVIYKTSEQNISDAQVLSQLVALNQDFSLKNLDAVNIPAAFRSLAADTRINFCLARVDPNGRLTSGIVRKYTSLSYFNGDDAIKLSIKGGDDAWNSQQYLNIWVCKLFGRSLGYATSPGSPANLDGVVINCDVFGTTGYIRAPFDKGRTATHEIGHWLGLKHIWGDQDCGNDDVDDTPTQLSYNYNCPSFPRLSPCSPNANGDMFMNFMDFTNDACMYMFTIGQMNKMRAAFANNGYRNSFLQSFACDSTRAAAGGPLPEVPAAIPVSKPSVITVTDEDVRIYPNPANGIINIESNEKTNLTGSMASLYNVNGKLVTQLTLQNSGNKMNVQAIPPGMYILKVGDAGLKKIFKVVKL